MEWEGWESGRQARSRENHGGDGGRQRIPGQEGSRKPKTQELGKLRQKTAPSLFIP